MSIPINFNPLGSMMQDWGGEGMWYENGILGGKLINLRNDKTLIGIDPNIDVSEIENGSYLFYGCTGLTEWNVDLPYTKNGQYMFSGCSNLSTFESELTSLTTGNNMFYGCSNLDSFNINALNLVSGSNMFQNTRLNNFKCVMDMPALKNVYCMFTDSRIKSYKGSLRELNDGFVMFYRCGQFESFESDISKMTRGERMFEGSTNFRNFRGNLSSLTNGVNMFNQCKLNLESVQCIYNTIQAFTDGSSHTITIGVDSLSVSEEEQNNADSVLRGRGWTVKWQRR